MDLRKLRDHCLNPLHDEGKHKALRFAAALGMTDADAEQLRAILLQAVTIHDAHEGYHDAYGQRYGGRLSAGMACEASQDPKWMAH
ncbi:MAG TPA: hypothetical protein VNP04_23455 [Alphaproteobacteria bacterium]|nr:hypothetical protein [Alphaproteobacteria bacterium]